ncbi:hypothetical protein PYCCODRAFT_279582 [Trametes coccinea BRFM310]|uniref:Uncharacterized protein n=1 Tax=Trametes coccinea (strain BRFM310) TaxID=1353009 RepID=A0A1Y2IPE3_TRAC3|nr:hypothetical protein PYCCODRAFT_279582 [Trametes coccinea BRFM310]
MVPSSRGDPSYSPMSTRTHFHAGHPSLKLSCLEGATEQACTLPFRTGTDYRQTENWPGKRAQTHAAFAAVPGIDFHFLPASIILALSRPTCAWRFTPRLPASPHSSTSALPFGSSVLARCTGPTCEQRHNSSRVLMLHLMSLSR